MAPSWDFEFGGNGANTWRYCEIIAGSRVWSPVVVMAVDLC
jgi:hypothetical protein